MTTSSIDIRTKSERERDAKHKAICNDYLTLSNEMAGVAAHRIFHVIAERHGMTIPGVRNIIIKAGLYTSR